MQIFKKILLLGFILFLPSAYAKYQVCTITINSADEKQVFQEHLSKDHFEFREILPQDSDRYKKNSSYWFDEACRADYKCDILIISGHFGGTFFGESGFTLPTDLMEQKSCEKSCKGILSQVKEIFLFGCNTLANKKKDTRTYQDYLNVLLEDGMARETAERVVASRYSPLESPFYKRMNFIFDGSATVYGFDQLSPLGEHIREPLNNYFKAINKKYGNYYNYLDKKGYNRAENKELLGALKTTTINQSHLPSISKNLKDEILFKNKCILFDDQAHFLSRTQALENIFSSENFGSAFFAIDYFLSRNQNRMLENRQSRAVFRDIKNSEHYSKKFRSFYSYLEHLPYIKIIYLNVLNRFQWIDSLDFKLKIKENVLSLIRKPNGESYVSSVLLLEDQQLKKRDLYFTEKDLPKGYIQNIWSLLILEKLQARVPHLQDEILEFCYSHLEKTPAICYQALNTLAHIQPEARLAPQISNFLDSKDEGLVFFSLRALGQTKTNNPKIHFKIASFLNHKNSNLRAEAIDALGFLKVVNMGTEFYLSQSLFNSDKKNAIDVLKFFSETDINDARVIDNILRYIIENADEEAFSYGIRSFKNAHNLSDRTANYFYKILDARDKSPYLHSLLKAIPQMEIKDIGVYYRLSQYHKLKDTEFKILVLESISSLEWFHPEIQVDLLSYLLDEDKRIRKLGLQLFKNIQNIDSRVLKKIKSLVASTASKNKELEDLKNHLQK